LLTGFAKFVLSFDTGVLTRRSASPRDSESFGPRGSGRGPKQGDSFGPRMISAEMESAAGREGSTQIPIRVKAIQKPRQDILAGFCVNPLVRVVRYRIIQLPD
jgi:hypothetical protein